MRRCSIVSVFFPFACFLTGYVVTHCVLHKEEVVLDNVIGKSLQESVAILSKKNLSVRLLHEREDSVLPEGTVLDQIPKPFQHVKPQQNIFLTISKKERPLLVPDFCGQPEQELVVLAQRAGIDVKVFHLPSDIPKGRCIAQQPLAGSFFEKNRNMLVYVSTGQQSLYVLPSFIGMMLPDVESGVKHTSLMIEVFHSVSVAEGHTCQRCRVVDQRPLGGSIVSLDRPLTVQIQVVEEPVDNP